MTSPFRYDLPVLLDGRFPLTLDRPFSTRQAAEAGISRNVLTRLAKEKLVRRMLKSVYVVTQLEDCLSLRAQALSFVVPPNAVVTDWTACWLHTGMSRPGDHLEVPPISMFLPAGQGRLRNALCASGERTFLAEDIMRIGNLWVTVPIRTAWDIGRFSPGIVAIGGIDGLLRLGAFTKDDLVGGVERFARQRGVVQLRELAPLADERAESPGESGMRYRWAKTPGLPAPTPQVPIFNSRGVEIYRIDLGVPEIMFGAEYQGKKWHSGDEDRKHDREKRKYLEGLGWTMRELWRENVFGAEQNAGALFRDGVLEARERMGRFRPPE